jgi:hypothetical protein
MAMNAKMSLIMKRTILALVFGVALVLFTAADATAHEIEYRPYYVQHHYAYARTRFVPAWLKRNREFHRWYVHSQYRFRRHISWHRLHDIYLLERRHRWRNRRSYARVYRDQPFRPHYSVAGKHTH